ncbi:MAG: hypothetical protein JWO50_252 [Candidatus Kaiserbacteria bacterium]|nr:hypothetical protein [Candidatus Kaiserbacteria bacterium]
MKRLTHFLRSNFLLAQTFDGGSIFRHYWLYVTFCFAICYLNIVRTAPIAIQLVYKKRKFTFHIRQRIDIAVLADIFVNQEYQFEYGDNIKNILDLGANIGDTAIFYAIHFPDATIYAIEPNPRIFLQLCKNAKQFDNIRCTSAALSSVDGTIELYESDTHLGFSVIQRNVKSGSVTVKSITLESMLKKYGVDCFDIIKFDIEGSETVLLEDPKLPTRTRMITGEMHDDLATIPLQPLVHSLRLEDMKTKTLNSKRYIIFGKINNTI